MQCCRWPQLKTSTSFCYLEKNMKYRSKFCFFTLSAEAVKKYVLHFRSPLILLGKIQSYIIFKTDIGVGLFVLKIQRKNTKK